MKKVFFLALFLLIPLTATATSWAYPFVVYNDSIYVITEEEATDVVRKIGKVTSYSDMYQDGGNFSNHYPKGTAYYKIDGVETTEAIAVEEEEGKYIIAKYESSYEYTPTLGDRIEKIKNIFDPKDEPIHKANGDYLKWVVFGVVIVVLALIFIVRRRDKK